MVRFANNLNKSIKLQDYPNPSVQTYGTTTEILVYSTHMYVKVNKFFGCNIVNIFFSIKFNVCFGCSKEPSHCKSKTFLRPIIISLVKINKFGGLGGGRGESYFFPSILTHVLGAQKNV